MMTMDEKLSAYLDGELSGDERVALEALLAADEELAGRLEALALANSEFAEHARRIDDIPMSDGLARQLASLEAAGSAGGTVAVFRPRRRLGGFFHEHRALAACAAVLAGVVVWQSMQPGGAPANGMDAGGVIYAGSDLDRMLNASPSETVVDLGEGIEGRVRFSFASAEGGYCRVADLVETAATSRIVACQEEGAWRVVIAAHTGGGTQGGEDLYRTASAHAAQSVETVLDALIFDAPMGAEEEAGLIARKWKPE